MRAKIKTSGKYSDKTARGYKRNKQYKSLINYVRKYSTSTVRLYTKAVENGRLSSCNYWKDEIIRKHRTANQPDSQTIRVCEYWKRFGISIMNPIQQ